MLGPLFPFFGPLFGAGDVVVVPELPARPYVGPVLLAGAPLGSLPLGVMQLAPEPPSGELSLFEQAADLSDVDIIHLVKLSPLTKVT